MKNIVNKFVGILCVLSITSSLTACGRPEIPATADLNQNLNIALVEQQQSIEQIIVKFKDGTTRAGINEFNAKYGTKTVKFISAINAYIIEKVGLGIKGTQLVTYFNHDSLVKYAELNESIQSNTDIQINPIYSLQGINFDEMIGKKLSIEGVYNSNRSGAVITTADGKLSILDVDGSVLIKLPNIQNGSRVVISGLIKETINFNNSDNIGIMPFSVKRVI